MGTNPSLAVVVAHHTVAHSRTGTWTYLQYRTMQCNVFHIWNTTQKHLLTYLQCVSCLKCLITLICLFFFFFFIGIFNIYKYIIENWVWLCCLGLELGLLCSAGPFFSSWELVLCEPSIGRAALVRPQKFFCPHGWGHNNLQPSHSSCPPVAELQDCATSPG